MELRDVKEIALGVNYRNTIINMKDGSVHTGYFTKVNDELNINNSWNFFIKFTDKIIVSEEKVIDGNDIESIACDQ
jgi:hypothetical protein